MQITKVQEVEEMEKVEKKMSPQILSEAPADLSVQAGASAQAGRISSEIHGTVIVDNNSQFLQNHFVKWVGSIRMEDIKEIHKLQ